MGYTRTNWQNDMIIEESALNNIESGIEKATKITDCFITSDSDSNVKCNRNFYTNSTITQNASQPYLQWRSGDDTERYGFVGKGTTEDELILKSDIGALNLLARSGAFVNIGRSATECIRVMHGNGAFRLEPSVDSLTDLGSPELNFRKLYLSEALATNSVNVRSDRALKENVEYISLDGGSNSNETITNKDMYSFVRDDLKLAKYNYINSSETSIGFIAQDCLESNVVGNEFVREGVDGLLSYDTASYTNIIAGALQTAIQKIESLEARIVELESK